jgi:hypothetical protein
MAAIAGIRTDQGGEMNILDHVEIVAHAMIAASFLALVWIVLEYGRMAFGLNG